MTSKWQKSRFIAPIIIVAVILLANVMYISGYSNPNPINTRSGLSNTLTPNLLSGENNIDPNDGFITQALGKESASDILHGKLPWWDYNQQVGAPLAGGMQAASFFPLVLIMYLSNGSTYFHIILEIIAGLAMYYLLLRLGLRKLTSTVGGIIFALSSVFVWFWTPNTNPIAFLPLLILGIEVAYARSKVNEKRGWLLIALALALSIYAGFPEVTGLDGLLAFCWVIVRLIQSEKSFRSAFFKKILAGAVTGILIAAPILIAFLDYLPYANIGEHANAITSSVNSIGLPALFMPYIYGPIFGLSNYDLSGNLNYFWSNVGGYITGLTFVLAILGLIGMKKRRDLKPIKILLAVWVVIMFLRIYGLFYLNTIMGHIPGLSQIAIYRYVQPSLVFAVIVLVAFGFDHLILTLGKIKDLRRTILVAGFATLAILLLLPLALTEHKRLIGAHHQRLWLVASIVWCLGAIAGVLIVLTLNYKHKINRKITERVLAIIVILDTMILFILPQFSAPRSATINTQPVVYIQQHIGEYRFYSMGPIMPNYGSYFNIAAINTNNVPVSKSWTDYAVSKLDSNSNPAVFTGLQGNSTNPEGLTPAEAFVNNLAAYEYLGVKYLITNSSNFSPGQANQTGLTKVFQDSTATIYKLPDPSPYFQIINGQCSLSSSSKANLSASCLEPSTLLRRELYVPGWSAEIGKVKVNAKLNNQLFQEFRLPKGKSQITFNYTPPHILVAFVSFCLSVVVICLCYIRSLNKKAYSLLTAVKQKLKK